MKMTPLFLLVFSFAVSTGCTPSGNDSQAQTPQSPINGQEDTDSQGSIEDQELALEEVGLKFIVDTHQQGDQELTYVSWDEFLREEWLSNHSNDGLDLQAQALQVYLELADQELAIQDDHELLIKKNLVKLTLKQIQ